MIRSLLIVILIVAFLILSIPILIVEWVIGKFNPYARDISSLRIVQFMFKLILFVAGTESNCDRRRSYSKRYTCSVRWQPQKLF